VKIHVSPSGRRIAPFGDPPGEILIQNRRLADWQADMIQQAEFERIEHAAPPCLQVPDTLFTTAAMLRRFADLAGGRNAVLVLKDSAFARRTTPVQPHVVQTDAGFRFEEIRFLSGDREPAADVLCDPDEKLIQIPVPAALTKKETIEFSLPRDPVITLHHWVHILWANEAAGAMLARRIPPARLALSGAWAFLRTWSVNRWRLLGKINQIGRGCDIHPTAVVEGSTLEDGVTVGAFARVMFSRIGRKANVMTGANVEASVLGERATVCQHTTVRLCVVYPGAIAGQRLMQMCLLGRDVVTVEGSWSIDLNLSRDARVPLDGTLHSIGSPFLGSAFGHGCRVGTGTWLAQGRMIPNGAFIVCAPDQVVSRIEPDLPADVALANDRGTLARIEGGVPSGRTPG
jgi:carbonic anhydrase/acetyltransferase-like protein (isoleucine patch superfamily)